MQFDFTKEIKTLSNIIYNMSIRYSNPIFIYLFLSIIALSFEIFPTDVHGNSFVVLTSVENHSFYNSVPRQIHMNTILIMIILTLPQKYYYQNHSLTQIMMNVNVCFSMIT